MSKIKNWFNKLKEKKAITGADITVAITIIGFSIGIVTSIYVNTINKSKDNIRYANAVRIATNIMESIQRQSYEILISTLDEDNYTEGDNRFEITDNEKVIANGGNDTKIFETKIPNGFKAVITAKPVETLEYDIARDVIINITYKASTSYKTITITSVKEKELMDMTNPPDFSLIPDYGMNSQYFYPVKQENNTNHYRVTTINDIDWYNYSVGKYALVYKTTTPDIEIGDVKNEIENVYVWIPRFVKNNTEGINGVKFLYGKSDNVIVPQEFSEKNNLFSYGKGNGHAGFDYTNTGFEENDGISGVWYKLSGDTGVANMAYTALNEKIERVKNY